MKHLLSIGILALAALCSACAGPEKDATTTTVTVRKIYDSGNHNAFTSLVKFKGKYYCTFREGFNHVFDDAGNAEGRVVIIASKNLKHWETVADIGLDSVDLRDPKLSITPDDRLMVTIGGSVYRNWNLVRTEPQVCFSEDGKTYTDPVPIQIDSAVRGSHDWVWRVTWHEGTGYGVTYRNGDAILLETADGIHYKGVCPLLPPEEMVTEDSMNEATIRFMPDGRMAILIRRDPGTALLAVAAPPFQEWVWHKEPLHIGGPDFLIREDESFIIGGRSFIHPGHVRTVLYRGLENGELDERYILLPSGGDTSYPGLLIEDDRLLVSYYSAEGAEGKAAIFLAELPLKLFD